MKNPARKKSVQSGDFRIKHAVAHVSAIMHMLPGYRGTYIWGYVLSGHCSRQQISGKNEGYLFSEGYLFTGFYGIPKDFSDNDRYTTTHARKPDLKSEST